MPEDFVPTYSYLADLAAACGWRLTLSRIENGKRFFLRVWDGEKYLGGIRYSASASRDIAAARLFESLHEWGLV